MEFSIDDREKDKKIIIHNFMGELCRRDDEDNRGLSTDRNRDLNVFPIEEIRQRNAMFYLIIIHPCFCKCFLELLDGNFAKVK